VLSFGNFTLTDRERRTLLIGAASIALLVAMRGVPVIFAWRRGEMERLRLKVRVSSLPPSGELRARVLQDSLVARRVRLAAMDSAFIPIEENMSAAAGFAEFFGDAAERAKLQLSSVRIEAPSDTGKKATISLVRVRASVNGNLTGLARLITMLERPPRLFVIRQLSITDRDANVPHDKNEVLDAEIVIEGLTQELPPQTVSSSTR